MSETAPIQAFTGRSKPPPALIFKGVTDLVSTRDMWGGSELGVPHTALWGGLRYVASSSRLVR